VAAAAAVTADTSSSSQRSTKHTCGLLRTADCGTLSHCGGRRAVVRRPPFPFRRPPPGRVVRRLRRRGRGLPRGYIVSSLRRWRQSRRRRRAIFSVILGVRFFGPLWRHPRLPSLIGLVDIALLLICHCHCHLGFGPRMSSQGKTGSESTCACVSFLLKNSIALPAYAAAAALIVPSLQWSLRSQVVRRCAHQDRFRSIQ
jgi:hypothetical protein